MPFKSLHLAVVVVGLTLQPRQLLSQVPIEVSEAAAASSLAYVRALKAALLNSPSVRVLDGGQTRRLLVDVVTGGSVRCGGEQARAVAILIGVVQSRASGQMVDQMVVAALYVVGNEEQAARGQLPNLHEAAVKLGVTGQSR